MKSIFPKQTNGGASIAVLVLAILGLIFVAQWFGFNITVYWPIILIVVIAVILWGM